MQGLLHSASIHLMRPVNFSQTATHKMELRQICQETCIGKEDVGE